MPSRSIDTAEQLKGSLTWLENLTPPFLISVTMGKHRSARQNKLQRKWCKEISEQLGTMTEEQVRGYCKAWFGLPIRLEDPVFAEVYERIIKPKPYEEKLEMMMVPLDMPITRDMTTKQKARYLDAMYVYWTARGIILTDPDLQGMEAT
jgi:hypothetical protein